MFCPLLKEDCRKEECAWWTEEKRCANQSMETFCSEMKRFRGLGKSHIYFIQDERGLIKIGKASNLKQRISNLQIAHPRELKLLLSFEETSELTEKQIQEEFKADNVSGEWFKPSNLLLNFIMKKGGKIWRNENGKENKILFFLNVIEQTMKNSEKDFSSISLKSPKNSEDQIWLLPKKAIDYVERHSEIRLSAKTIGKELLRRGYLLQTRKNGAPSISKRGANGSCTSVWVLKKNFMINNENENAQIKNVSETCLQSVHDTTSCK